ncbi:MAG: S9 family peptidase [Myxococcota bacterium]|nr:S9 family peptidase [Myxococcota bacterium]
MKKTSLFIGILILSGCASSNIHQDLKTPPIAKKIRKELVSHGDTRIDNYYWLRDDERKNPEILNYLRQETAYADAQLEPIKPNIDYLYEEMTSKLAKDDSTVPALRNQHLYWKEYVNGKEYAIHYRTPKGSDSKSVILDENLRAKGHKYYRAGRIEPSSTGRYLAIAEDVLSRRIYTLRIKDLESGEFLSDEISNVAPAAVWSADDKYIFYIRKEKGTLREYQIWRHQIGAPVSEDTLVYEEKDSEFYVWVWKTRSDDYVVISSMQTLSTEHRVIPAAQPTQSPKIFLPREKNHEYSISHDKDRWLIRTNWEAKNFQVMQSQLTTSADKSTWKPLFPKNDEIFIRSVDAFEDYVVIGERRDGLPGLRILRKKDQEQWSIEFSEPVFSARLVSTNYEYSTSTIRYSYTSLTTPRSEYDYDIESRKETLLKEDPVLGNFKKGNYKSERVWITATDGTKVPVSIVYHKDLDRSKAQPLYLYGYGSYGASLDPWFSVARLSLLDRGVIYAIAHIRGGQELGRQWYENGKLFAKRNTFTDFIDAAKNLIELGYTSSNLLAVSGGSAGGLLIGAVINMRPDLFEAAVAKVPFVDVVTTMLDESIPLTTFEYDEWGNPNKPDYYEYMLSYSPYDNVGPYNYPAIFVFTGLHDSQVQYWEPAKWVAKLRANSTSDRPLLFRVNMEAGHGGSSGRFRRYQEIAMEYAWILERLGASLRPKNSN